MNNVISLTNGKIVYSKKSPQKEPDVNCKMFVGGNGVYAVDENGYIGLKVNDFIGNYAIVVEGADFSNKGLGQLTLIEKGSAEIGGKTYSTVTIGSQTWLAQNLDLDVLGSVESNRKSIDAKYGRLYQWNVVKSLSIAGWHLPTRAEWNTLYSNVGNDALKLMSESWNGSDVYGFGVLPAGRYDTDYRLVGSRAYFWTSENDSTGVYDFYFDGDDADISRLATYDYLSVRLVKD